MEVHYDNTKLAKKCKNERAIRRNFPNHAERILERLLDLKDFPNLQQYLESAKGRPHWLRENLSGRLWVHVSSSNVIMFEPLAELTFDENGNPDNSKVTAVNILHVNVPETDFKDYKKK